MSDNNDDAGGQERAPFGGEVKGVMALFYHNRVRNETDWAVDRAISGIITVDWQTDRQSHLTTHSLSNQPRTRLQLLPVIALYQSHIYPPSVRTVLIWPFRNNGVY